MALSFQARARPKVNKRILKIFMVLEFGKGWSESEREMERDIFLSYHERRQSSSAPVTSLPSRRDF